MPTEISWAEETWNPTVGCTKVSPGCDGCYAIRQARIRAANPNPKIAAAYEGVVERTDVGLDWTGRVNLLPDRLDAPLRWREPRRIFVDSMSDLFHEQVSDEFIARVFAVMAAAPQHTFQVLTKRHGRMRSLLSRKDFGEQTLEWGRATMRARDSRPRVIDQQWPLPNVWLGVSVEDQKRADLRIPALLDTPAAVRWLSCEPLLGPLELAPWFIPWNRALTDGIPWERALSHSRANPEHTLKWYGDGWGEADCDSCGFESMRGVDWVVVGGESGPGARPMHPAWARSLRGQCQSAAIAFHFKQWGEWAPAGVGIGMARHNFGREVLVGPPLDDMGHRQVMRRVGQNAAGRELDGRVWDEYPTVAAS